jgi:hypothetical protein
MDFEKELCFYRRSWFNLHSRPITGWSKVVATSEAPQSTKGLQSLFLALFLVKVDLIFL